MTLRALIDFCRTLRPGVPHKDDTFLVWINELESEIATQVMLLDISNAVRHTEYTEELLADDAHTKLYWTYLCAMIDLANGEYSRYQNDVEVFNGLMSDYRIWYADNYDPANGRAEAAGYYISAYALAVKHGYEGTEEEWVAYISANADRSEAAREGALAAQTAAEAAKEAAESARDGAKEAETGAVTAKTAAEAAHTGAQAAKSAAEAAHAGAVGA